jgi:hypothetical protein
MAHTARADKDRLPTGKFTADRDQLRVEFSRSTLTTPVTSLRATVRARCP